MSTPNVTANLSPAESAGLSDVRIVDVHSLHKSGTMFLFKFFQHLAGLQNTTFLSENHAPPDDYHAIPSSDSSVKPTVCRCPLRTFEVEDFRIPVSQQRRIFHLRDPRDILVSEYFSFGWIHSTDNTPLDQRRLEIQKMSVDEYVIRQSEQSAWPVDQKYAPLIDYQFDSDLETVVKYEEMVTKFPRWCEKVVNAYGVRFPKLLMLRLAWRYRNEFKSSGEAMQHKRRITPGDFREKLQPATIKILNDRFAPILDRFEYAQ